MIEDLIERMLALDLLITELEGDDWCTQADLILQESAEVVERLNLALKGIAAAAHSAVVNNRLN